MLYHAHIAEYDFGNRNNHTTYRPRKLLLKQAEILSVASPQTREAEIQSGRADVFISDYPYTRRMLLFYDWTLVIEAPSPVSP